MTSSASVIAVVVVVATVVSCADAALPGALPLEFTALYAKDFTVNGGGPGNGFVSTGMYFDGVNRRLMAVNNQMNNAGVNASFEWIMIDVGAGYVQGAGGGEVGQNDCCQTPVPSYWHWEGSLFVPKAAYTGATPPCLYTDIVCYTGDANFVGSNSIPATFCYRKDWSTSGNNNPVCWFEGTQATANPNTFIGFQPGQPYPSFLTTAPACSTKCSDATAANLLAAAPRAMFRGTPI